MKILSMVPSQHISERFYINLEDGQKLPVNIAIIADLGLFSGRDLTIEDIDALKKASNDYIAKSKALKMTSFRPMSKKEIETKLKQKNISEESSKNAVEFLERIGAVNDSEYAHMIVKHYQAKGYGIGKIKSELSHRGIPKELWDEALEEMSDSSQIIDTILEKKLRTKEATPEEIKKVTASLYRRGFTWEEIKSAIQRYNIELED